jgi:hypothetical protein
VLHLPEIVQPLDRHRRFADGQQAPQAMRLIEVRRDLVGDGFRGWQESIVMTVPALPLTNGGIPSIPRQRSVGLNLACLMSSVSRRNGGIFEAERQLCRSLVDQHGIHAKILAMK